ncbi:MAG: nucleoside hydrolase [Anaerolineae bacterium]
MQHFLIDTDTGSDDAVALVMALRSPNVQVEAITTVAGNVPLEMATQNALYTVELCGKSTPVYAGIAKPMIRAYVSAQDVHGLDGMGDLGLPLTGRRPAPGHAVHIIGDLIRRSPGEITLVTLGPLTNIAAALLIDPSLAYQVKRCVVMGGASDGIGNMTPTTEYNIYADPEAARIVFESGMPITMVGWDIARKYALISEAEEIALRDLNTPLAAFAVDINRLVKEFEWRVLKLVGFTLPDPVAMAVALDPSIITGNFDCYASVETNEGRCYGQMVLDQIGWTQRPATTTAVTAIARDRFIDLLRGALR